MRKILFMLLSLLMVNSVASAQDTIPAKKNFAQNAELFSQGLENKFNENFDVAIEYFEKAIEVFPQDHASMYELSALYTIKGRADKGFEMIQQAVELDNTNKWYKIRLADFHKQNRDYEAFIGIYDELLENEPNNLEYLEVYIEALLNIGDYERVTEKLDVYEENIGVNEYLSLQKIEIYNLLGKKDKVVSEMEKLSEAYPYETRYMSMLAETYVQYGREKDAFPLYLKIKQLNPEDPYINISLLEYYQKQGDIDKAFEEFISSIKNKNLDYNTKAQIYEYWFNQKEGNDKIVKEAEMAGKAFIETHPDKELGYYVIGTVYFNKEVYDKAQNYYLDAIARDSSSFITWYQLVFTDIELQNADTLYKHSKSAMRFYPEQPIFYLFNGVALIDMKKYEEAIKVFEKGRKMSADKKLTSSFDTYIADIHHELGNKDKMYQSYDKVLKNDPENVYVLNNYAYFLSVDGIRLDEALKMSAITVEKEPKNVTYIDTYAWILYKLGRYKDARRWMEKVFSYDKNPQGIYYEHYGDILYMSGDTKKAVQNWKKAKKIGGTSEFIDQKIKDEKIYE
ncbi:MAG: tetratricopeptide repeat protein [Bacteroidales bacterium]|nr:tetratricopeptide repeat protein [Bacteroidales bacterium]MBR5782529.1 tetratricopeptide repeat protein [Bacteroidales bacterium]